MRKSLLLMLICLLGLPGSITSKPETLETILPQDYLTSKKYSKLIVEVIHDKHQQPNPEAIDCLVEKLKLYCNKTNIAIKNTEVALIASDSKLWTYYNCGLWTSATLQDFKRSFQRYKTENETVVLHILYLPGFIIADFICVGQAFTDDAFVIFSNRIPSKWEASVLIHEMGHIFGLVNEQSKHHDISHYWHCKNIKCTMYWCIDDDLAPTTDFDVDCEKFLYSQGARINK